MEANKRNKDASLTTEVKTNASYDEGMDAILI
jgi:hypothetical protein